MQLMTKQSGFLLIEALVALLIFAFGILGLIALQATVIKVTGEAKYRMEAVQFTNQLLGDMWADGQTLSTDKTAFQTAFSSPDGPRFQLWAAEVTNVGTGGLPGAATVLPTVVFGANNQVTITVSWQQPGGATHQHVTVTQLQ